MKNIAFNLDSISLKTYFKELKKIELLSSEEQTELAIKAKNGDNKALKELVKCNLRFVFSVAKDFRYSDIPLEDLINEGNIGLIKAVEKFDENKGFKFISYAVWWIRQSILQAIYDHGNIVRLPVNRININNKISKARNKLYSDLSREPTSEEISQLADICEDDIRNYCSENNPEVSLSESIFSENPDGTVEEKLEGEGFELIEMNSNRSSLRKEINSVLSTLTKRESTIVRLYFGLDTNEEMTLKEIGEKLDLTNERVRQIKEFALKKLRLYNKSSKLREFLDCRIS